MCAPQENFTLDAILGGELSDSINFMIAMVSITILHAFAAVICKPLQADVALKVQGVNSASGIVSVHV